MIDQDSLAAKFVRIGARLKLYDGDGRRTRVATSGPVRLDIGTDGDGEFFEIRRLSSADAQIEVLDVQPSDRHLLLMVRELTAKPKYLCGHDERHWFVAAVPESASVGTVRAAKEALKPPEVRVAQAVMRVGSGAGNRRKNAAFRRQGEWFFVPAPGLKVDAALVLRDEPITRGIGSKPHRCEFLYREGGVAVYACRIYPSGVDENRYRQILRQDPDAVRWGWRMMRLNPWVYVRGRVRHADHKTIMLHGWHRVLMNTEHQSQAMRNLAFLD